MCLGIILGDSVVKKIKSLPLNCLHSSGENADNKHMNTEF